MSSRYDFSTVEPKWQRRWNETGLFRAPDHPDPDRKYYMLEMFAYPSGDLHMGHFRNYGIGDAYTRWLLMNGREVLHPFGWDAFGMPAENAAIKRGIHPQEWTLGNIAQSRTTMKEIGIGYDWDREITTCLPDYYTFTQWMFLTLNERGLVYRKDAPVNWCDQCTTVLANEQVQDGRCWRCDGPVGKRDLEQWYIKITEYCQRLHDGLDTLDHWPKSTIASQRNWIGRSEGSEIDFAVQDAPEGSPESLTVFTTRPDTLWGVTFVTVAPESAFGRYVATHGPNAAEVAAYAEAASQKSDLERTAVAEKTGVDTGFAAVHPCTGEAIPIYVSDYVLASYGTGCVMGVPAHDERDFQFARLKGLPIRVVILPAEGDLDPATMEGAYTEPGTITASGPFDGRRSDEAIPDIIAWLDERGAGRAKVTFRLHDWLISRQRYWGCPIPMVHCPDCGIVPVPKDQLPVLLPENVENWIPKGRSPLADVEEFMSTTCPECDGPARRDADTMDTFICSAWYHLRYTDPKNTEMPFDPEKAKAWLPVDFYIGGAEHANGHLIYFRFITKVLKDAGWLDIEEPVVRMLHHGMVADSEGHTMSKSRGNVISPVETTRENGVDAARIAMFFFAPSDEEISWRDTGVGGAKKLVQRVHDVVMGCAPFVKEMPADVKGGDGASKAAREVRLHAHAMLQQFDHAFAHSLAFNTGIAAVYKLLNVFPDPAEASAAPEADRACYAEAVRILVGAFAPIAPHLCEELHEELGGSDSVFRGPWPVCDPDALVRDAVEIAVQVKGKVRSRIEVPSDASKDDIEAAALACPRIRELIGDKEVRRVIVVPGRLVNIIA